MKKDFFDWEHNGSTSARVVDLSSVDDVVARLLVMKNTEVFVRSEMRRVLLFVG